MGCVHRHRAQEFRPNKLTWTLVANGKTGAIPASLDPLWELSPFKDATGNTPPFIGFTQAGPFVNGPRGQTQTISGTMSNPVPLTLWVADDASVVPGATRPRTPAVTLTWSKFRGPGDGHLREGSARDENAQVKERRIPCSAAKQPPRRLSANLENTCCTWLPTIGPAKAAAASSAAGPTPR